MRLITLLATASALHVAPRAGANCRAGGLCMVASSASASSSDDELIRATLSWLDGFVIKLNLCPFAAAYRKETRVVVDRSVDASIAVLSAELARLRSVPPHKPATTLVLMPRLSEFQDLMAAQAAAEELADADAGAVASSAVAPVQVLAFHPHAAYGDVTLDAADFSTRSPVPMLHLLRDADVEKAEHSWAAQHAPHSAPGIQERNQALLRGRGYEACVGDAAAAAGMDPWSI